MAESFNYLNLFFNIFIFLLSLVLMIFFLTSEEKLGQKLIEKFGYTLGNLFYIIICCFTVSAFFTFVVYFIVKYSS